MERIIPKHNVHLQLWLCGKCSGLVFVWIEVSRKSFGKKTICIKIKKKKVVDILPVGKPPFLLSSLKTSV